MSRWATFDCYGTLIDWNTGIGRVLEQLYGAEQAPTLLRRYHEGGDSTAREELIERHLPLVRSLARRYAGALRSRGSLRCARSPFGT